MYVDPQGAKSGAVLTGGQPPKYFPYLMLLRFGIRIRTSALEHGLQLIKENYFTTALFK